MDYWPRGIQIGRLGLLFVLALVLLVVEHAAGLEVVNQEFTQTETVFAVGLADPVLTVAGCSFADSVGTGGKLRIQIDSNATSAALITVRDCRAIRTIIVESTDDVGAVASASASGGRITISGNEGNAIIVRRLYGGGVTEIAVRNNTLLGGGRWTQSRISLIDVVLNASGSATASVTDNTVADALSYTWYDSGCGGSDHFRTTVDVGGTTVLSGPNTVLNLVGNVVVPLANPPGEWDGSGPCNEMADLPGTTAFRVQPSVRVMNGALISISRNRANQGVSAFQFADLQPNLTAVPELPYGRLHFANASNAHAIVVDTHTTAAVDVTIDAVISNVTGGVRLAFRLADGSGGDTLELDAAGSNVELEGYGGSVARRIAVRNAVLKSFVVSDLNGGLESLTIANCSAISVAIRDVGATHIELGDLYIHSGTSQFRGDRLQLQRLAIGSSLTMRNVSVLSPFGYEKQDHNCGNKWYFRPHAVLVDDIHGGPAGGPVVVRFEAVAVAAINASEIAWPTSCWRATTPWPSVDGVRWTSRGPGLPAGSSITLVSLAVDLGVLGDRALRFEPPLGDAANVTIELPAACGNASVLIAPVSTPANTAANQTDTAIRVRRFNVTGTPRTMGSLTLVPGPTSAFVGPITLEGSSVAAAFGDRVSSGAGHIDIDLSGVQSVAAPGLSVLSSTLDADLRLVGLQAHAVPAVLVRNATAARVVLRRVEMSGPASEVVIENSAVTQSHLVRAHRIDMDNVSLRDRARIFLRNNTVRSPYSYRSWGSGCEWWTHSYAAIAVGTVEGFHASGEGTVLCIGRNRVIPYGTDAGWNFTTRRYGRCDEDPYDDIGVGIRIGQGVSPSSSASHRNPPPPPFPVIVTFARNATLRIAGNAVDLGPELHRRFDAYQIAEGTLFDGAHLHFSSGPATGGIRLTPAPHSNLTSAVFGVIYGIEGGARDTGVMIALGHVASYPGHFHIENSSRLVQLSLVFTPSRVAASSLSEIPGVAVRNVTGCGVVSISSVAVARGVHVDRVEAEAVHLDAVALLGDRRDRPSPSCAVATAAFVAVSHSALVLTAAFPAERIRVQGVVAAAVAPAAKAGAACSAVDGTQPAPVVTVVNVTVLQPWTKRIRPGGGCGTYTVPKHAVLVGSDTRNVSVHLSELHVAPFTADVGHVGCDITLPDGSREMVLRVAPDGHAVHVDAAAVLDRFVLRDSVLDPGSVSAHLAVVLVGSITNATVLLRNDVPEHQLRLVSNGSLAVVGNTVNGTTSLALQRPLPPATSALLTLRRYAACNAVRVARGANAPIVDHQTGAAAEGVEPLADSCDTGDAAQALAECSASSSSSTTFHCAPTIAASSAPAAVAEASAVLVPVRLPACGEDPETNAERTATPTQSTSASATQPATMSVTRTPTRETEPSVTLPTSPPSPPPNTAAPRAPTATAPATETPAPVPATGRKSKSRSQSPTDDAPPPPPRLGITKPASAKRTLASSTAATAAAAATAASVGVGALSAGSVSSAVRLGDAAGLAGCESPDDPVDVSWLEYPVQFGWSAGGRAQDPAADDDASASRGVAGYADLLGAAVLSAAVLVAPFAALKRGLYGTAVRRSGSSGDNTCRRAPETVADHIAVIGSVVFPSYVAPAVVRAAVILVPFAANGVAAIAAAASAGVVLATIVADVATVDRAAAQLRRSSNVDDVSAPFERYFGLVYDGNCYCEKPIAAPRGPLHYYAVEVGLAVFIAACSSLRLGPGIGCQVASLAAVAASACYLAYLCVYRPYASTVEARGALLVGVVQLVMCAVAALAVAGAIGAATTEMALAGGAIAGAAVLVGQAALVAVLEGLRNKKKAPTDRAAAGGDDACDEALLSTVPAVLADGVCGASTTLRAATLRAAAKTADPPFQPASPTGAAAGDDGTSGGGSSTLVPAAAEPRAPQQQHPSNPLQRP